MIFYLIFSNISIASSIAGKGVDFEDEISNSLVELNVEETGVTRHGVQAALENLIPNLQILYWAFTIYESH